MGRVRGLSAKGTAATHPVSGKPKCTSALPLLAVHRAPRPVPSPEPGLPGSSGGKQHAFAAET